MSNKTQPNADTIATVALELTKAIASADNREIKTDKNSNPKAFYLDLYKDCYQHVKNELIETLATSMENKSKSKTKELDLYGMPDDWK
ncbi:MAG: hypothetical protein KGV51_03150 [Moraxellaceae bacterium]|nr:hypothetical protein [Moraxellaceae bacterium]